MTTTDEWAGWRKLLAGEKVDTDPNTPFTGFYRLRKFKGGPFVPVAYWRDGSGNLVCVIDGKIVSENVAVDKWTYCCAHPIPHEAYLAVAERGEDWPDIDATVAEQIKAPAPGHNNPPQDEAELLKEQIESATAGVFAYSKIEDDETLAKAQSLRARLNELSRTADKKRETDKKPHMEEAKKVDSRWMPLVKMAKDAADGLARVMSAFETAKLRKEQEAKRKADEAARKAEAEGKPAPVAPPPAPAPGPVKGAYGRGASVKLIKVATIVDQDKVYAFMRDRPEIKELLGKLAQRAVDAGHDVAGVSVEEQRKVA